VDAGLPGFGDGLDTGRADAVLPVLRLLLGTTAEEDARRPPGHDGPEAPDADADVKGEDAEGEVVT
jgi:hypothetical protein